MQPIDPTGKTRINTVDLAASCAKICMAALGLERDLIADIRGPHETSLGNIVKA